MNNETLRIIIGAILAIIAGGLVFKFVIRKKSNKNSGTVNIKNSNVGGDVAGRDIKK